jgi:hypothetical protein
MRDVMFKIGRMIEGMFGSEREIEEDGTNKCSG